MPKNDFTVVLVGRANVGKSTLFNALCETRKALVSPIAGTTRDMNTSIVNWKDASFRMVDTGGLDVDPKNPIEEQIIKQGKKAIKKADFILFVTDGKEGLLHQDYELAKALRRQEKPVVLVVNKMDNPKLRSTLGDFYALGFDRLIGTSAVNGSGLGDLLDEIYDALPVKKRIIQKQEISIALIGKPNSGKSSLLNIFLGEQRAIVSDIAHTTRTSTDEYFTHNDTVFHIVDTAGIRRKSKTKAGLEKLSIMQSLQAIKECDIALLLVEVQKGIESIDKRLAQLIAREQKGMIIVGNKWDLVEDKKTKSAKEFEEKLQTEFAAYSYAPIILASAKTGKHTHKLLDLVKEIHEQRNKKIHRSELTALLDAHPYKKAKPSRAKQKNYATLHGMQQIDTNPPVFAIMTGAKDVVAKGYINTIEKALRKKYGFKGTPIHVITIPLSSR